MKKTIAFVTSGLEFNGHSTKRKALGGSESALIYMAREMATLGHDVTVYCPCDFPGNYDRVDYRHVDQYMRDEKPQFDVLIVSRFTDYLALPLDTKMNILWCHDIDSNNFRDAIGVADRVFCLSDYHKGLFTENYTIADSNYIWKTSNGFDQDIEVNQVAFDQKKNNYIYSSRPERGLKMLLEKIWPEIVAKNPDATLHLCGYEHNIGMPEHVQKIHDEVADLLRYSSNIKQMGTLAKADYYKLLSTCGFMVYPTEFPEISCINAIESQLNGCLVITTDGFALTETVKTDTKVMAEIGTQQYVDEFLALVDKFQDPQLYQDQVDRAQKIVTETYSWKSVAASWDAEIDKMFDERQDKWGKQVIDRLVYNSDIVAAWKLTGDQKYRDMLDKAAVDNVTISDFRENVTDEDAYLNDRSMKLISLVQAQVTMFPNKKITILDVGSNNGILSLPLLKRFSKNIEKLIMYDSSAAVLNDVSKAFGEKYPQLECVVDEGQNLHTHNFAPDIVIVGELLEHIEDTQSFLDQLIKLRTTNTLFYFTVPHGPWENMVKRDKVEYHHVHHFELEDIKQIFCDVDLTVDHTSRNCLGRRGEPCGNWIFWFHASKEDAISFGQVDYKRKQYVTRPYKSISFCMIVRNEEDNLSRCLKSIKLHADEIIIVDTGSTDITKQIASKYTDKIFDLEWLEADGLGNFSRARNYSLDQATGDYIFWIDADEQLEGFVHTMKFITSDYYDGIMFKQQQCMSKASHDSGINVDVMHDRLFKRGKIRFTGVVHEYPSADDEHFLGNMFWQQYGYVLHYGLANQELLKQKSLNRNSSLIYKNIATYPDRVFAKHYLMVDMWSKFITDHPDVNFAYAEEALRIWHEEMKDCGDPWTVRLCLSVVQHFYSYFAANQISYKGKQVEKVSLKNQHTNEVLEFFVLDASSETEMFTKYLSEYKR